MTEVVHPSAHRGASSSLLAGSFRYGVLSDGWIAPAGVDYLAQHTPVARPLNAFAFTTSGLTVTVTSGEAFVGGGWLATDETYTIDLTASTAGQTIYVGWDRYAANNVIVGKTAAFDVLDDPDNPKLALGTFSTDTTAVISSTDHRLDYLGPSQSFINRTYDPDGDGVVDDTARVGGIAASALMRKDQNQTMNGHMTFANGFNVTGGGASFNTNASFNAPANFNGNEAQGFRIENRTTRPTNPAVGQIIYRTDKD